MSSDISLASEARIAGAVAIFLTHLQVRSGELAGGLWQAILRSRQKKHASVSGFFGLSSIKEDGRVTGGGAGILGIDKTR